MRLRLGLVSSLLTGIWMTGLQAAQTPPLTLSPRPTWTVEGDPESPGFAAIVAPAGDVNRDGCADVLVGHLGQGGRSGRVLAYYGSTNGLPSAPSWIGRAPDDRRDHSFGAFAAGGGDVNGDGYDDIVAKSDASRDVPAPRVDELYLFPGSATGLVSRVAWRFRAPHFAPGGIHTAGRAGDVNRDGDGDFFVVASPETGGTTLLLLFHGSTNGPASEPAAQWHFAESHPNARVRAAAAGDINQDDFDDLIVGDLFWSDGRGRSGRVLVFAGSTNGLRPEPLWTASLPRDASHFAREVHEQSLGHSVTAGDFNDDGFLDVVAGALHGEHHDYYDGLVFAWRGSLAGPATHPCWRKEGNSMKAVFGWEVSTGDLNGDGFADLAVGAPGFSMGAAYSSAVFVFHGSDRGLLDQPAWSFGGGPGKHTIGSNLDFVGDVNGDGFADLLVGDHDFQHNQKVVGRALVFYGDPAGLANSAGLSLTKPLLTTLQQIHDHTPFGWKLGGAGGLLTGTEGFFVAWRRALSRLRASERAAARAAERERLARDIHDQLGANLGEIALWTELTTNAPLLPESLKAPVARIFQSARTTLESISRLVWTLDSAHDSLEEFAGHLTATAEQFLEAAGLLFMADLPNPLPTLALPADTRDHLDMMTKEVLRNVVQHAEARTVTLQLRIEARQLHLRISDDGRGFAADSPHPKQHGATKAHGLRNLKARAKALGGRLEIVSSPGRGTAVRIVVPLSKT